MNYNLSMTDKTNLQPTGYTAASLADIAQVSRVYIARLCREGKLECDRVGGVWFIRYEVGQRWLKERQAKQAQEH